MGSILVTGGAGYIGSHTVRMLVESGRSVVVADNLGEGHSEAVIGAVLEVGDIRDSAFLDRVFRTHEPDAVIHFASHCYVGESVSNPRRYFEDNLQGALMLLGCMIDHSVDRFVFSSTCATYGDPEEIPMTEDHPQRPVNPYGESKYFIECFLRRYEAAFGLRAVALRYFNAAGASADARIGESHDPETHLVPLLLQVAAGKRSAIEIFGEDYPTPDGTCIRDYVHVDDLADAHQKALGWLESGRAGDAFNLGTGFGYSVREVLSMVEEVSGRPVAFRIGPRRAGDPPALVADSSRAGELLDWVPRYSSLRNIVETAWRWESNRRY